MAIISVTRSTFNLVQHERDSYSIVTCSDTGQKNLVCPDRLRIIKILELDNDVFPCLFSPSWTSSHFHAACNVALISNAGQRLDKHFFPF